MKINDASRSSGLSRDMIRYYEKIGLVSPSRLPNGYRDYTDDDLYLLTVIKYLSNLGVPLKRISKAFETGQTNILEEDLRGEIDHLNQLKSQINARIAAAQDSIACFEMLSSGTPWEVYAAKERFLLSFGHLQYPVYRTGPERGDFFHYYYRQRYHTGEKTMPQGTADRGLLLYTPLPGTEHIPAQECLRVILAHPSGSLVDVDDLDAPLQHACRLTGKTEFSVLIHQFFQMRRYGNADILCAEILLGS